MPFKPNQREYRSVFTSFHAAGPADGGDDREGFIVEGYATTFDSPYQFGDDSHFECISSRAFDSADMSDVVFQENHEGSPLARLKNGSMSVEMDCHGLKVRADLGGSQRGRELYEAISNGLIDSMSWGFTVANDGWEYDRDTRTATVTKVKKVYDVSAVTFPANSDTEIHARSYIDGVIDQEKQELLERGNDERRRLALLLKINSI